VTVDYGAAGTHTFHAGEAFVEAMETHHKGHNTGTVPVRILAVSMGAEGTADVVVDK
jgi:mannose-6-phosphate isomerase-like protein (cupin superfamily)